MTTCRSNTSPDACQCPHSRRRRSNRRSRRYNATTGTAPHARGSAGFFPESFAITNDPTPEELHKYNQLLRRLSETSRSARRRAAARGRANVERLRERASTIAALLRAGAPFPGTAGHPPKPGPQNPRQPKRRRSRRRATIRARRDQRTRQPLHPESPASSAVCFQLSCPDGIRIEIAVHSGGGSHPPSES